MKKSIIGKVITIMLSGSETQAEIIDKVKTPSGDMYLIKILNGNYARTIFPYEINKILE